MSKPISKVVKSKSSNSAMTTKSDPRNKKTRSNAEFRPLVLKKRGVYVEKKPTDISITEHEISPVTLPLKPPSPRPIPRAGRKRFLASVLNILSQSTTGTQYPEQDDTDRLKKFDRAKIKLRKKREEIIQENATITQNGSKRKRYRSKFLSHNNSDLEQLVVLQSTKEITHTPSNYSDKSNHNYHDALNAKKEHVSVKWAEVLPSLGKNTIMDSTVPDDTIQDGRRKKDKRVRLVENEPSTLVAQVPKKEERKLYNFFVDLLETTFNVYNVKTEFHAPPPSSVNSSKVALEMDESVAKKLNLQNDNVTTKHSSKFNYIKPNANERWDDQRVIEHFLPSFFPYPTKRSRNESPTKSLKKKNKLYSESFDYKKPKLIPVTNSLIPPNKLLKKERKKHFLNLLKEQLKMEDDAFEEPQNFFQALKVIARNKRRCQKSIHTRESKKFSEGDVHVCQFKRRRLLSARIRKSRSSKPNNRNESDFIRSMRSFTINSNATTTSRKRNTITITETTENELDPSQHSLEVFGYDYETNVKKKSLPSIENNYPSSYHSACSGGPNYDVNDSIYKYSDSGSSTALMRSYSRLTPHGHGSLNKLLE